MASGQQHKPTGDEKPDAPRAAREAQREADPPADAETFDHDLLIQAAGSFGYQPHEVAGALSAVSKKHLTLDEAKAATAAWLQAPVQTDSPEA